VSSKDLANLPASVRARLKNRADELGLDFNQAIQYYTMERFLYRLSKTKWADVLIVKGAAMLRVWDGAIARPTRDIDFLARIDNSPEAIAAMVRECLAVESADGVTFSPEIDVEPITVEEKYPGVRATISGELSGARMRLQLDFGVGDLAVPEPGWVDYPTLLGTDAPRILAYQPSTTVAEKFQTMIDKGLLNSRLKDYYDIWMMAGAVTATFERRGTPIPSGRPRELGKEFTTRAAAQMQWASFVKKMESSGVVVPQSLDELVDGIADFIVPAAAAAAARESFAAAWVPGEGWSPA
jgi:predicted nucleotidyltransferase component of viral defense system